jgi:2-methylisoborneol synthase
MVRCAMARLPDLSAPAVEASLAALVAALLSNPDRPAADRLPVPEADDPPAPEEPTAEPSGAAASLVPTGFAESAAQLAVQPASITDRLPPAPPPRPQLPGQPSGPGTSAWWIAGTDDEPEEEADDDIPPLFCPGPVRDDPALGELVNEGILSWAEEVGIYPGRLDRLRRAGFGRLIMLTHPGTDDPDRLLAAGKCVVAEWAADDYYVDEVELGSDPNIVGDRLSRLYAVIDPAGLPRQYAPQLDGYRRQEPIATAFRTAMRHLAKYTSAAQMGRFQHQMAILFVAWNQEADWHRNGKTPAVWEYLVQRHLNSYLPPMILIDVLSGYEVPAYEFYDPRIRRAFMMAGAANVLLNDLHSAAFESDTDFNLPRVIAIEEKCTQREAIKRTVEIHNELMHTFVEEAAAVCLTGSPMLQRFFLETWAWMGGSREWHATTRRYKQDDDSRSPLNVQPGSGTRLF